MHVNGCGEHFAEEAGTAGGLDGCGEGEQAEKPPRVFTRIHLTYRIKGKVSEKAAEDAVSLSKGKYCSVSKMLEKSAFIDYSIEYES